ncbi:MAG TPA: hypothetical protein VEY87_12060 [Gaiellaceae bacterium]|nr:hypothetical protein [Gaiellaceae bacterium]
MDAADERRLAVALFNHVWTLLELPERTREQDDELVHAAHASRHHWAAVGTARNLARGEWQVSRVYAVLGRAEPALYHGRRCLELLEASGDGEDWDVPFAHEALARAYFLAGDGAAAQQHLGLARELGAAIADAGDRDHLERELADLAAPY